jgi:putative phosphoesterase
MRLCLVSDSHRYRHELLSAAKSVPRIDAILHAGDEVEDVRWLQQKVDWPIYAVAGNWDTPSAEFPQERVITEFGPTILLTHGHQWKVKEGISALAKHALEVGATIVVFGHTHTAMTAMSDGVLFVNPGSLAAPRGRRERTFAVMEIEPMGEDAGYDVRVSHYTAKGELTSGQLRTRLYARHTP